METIHKLMNTSGKLERDLSIAEITNGFKYDGAMNKEGVTINGSNYIAKKNKNDWNLNVYCEYIASRFINNLAPCFDETIKITAHETNLFKDATTDSLYVLVKDFIGPERKLIKYFDIQQAGMESRDSAAGNRRQYEFSTIIKRINNHKKIADHEKSEIRSQFWIMFFLDAILGNRDRHGGNWGFLDQGNGYKMAPIYDNGSALFPEIKAKMNQYLNNRSTFILKRCEGKPKSAIRANENDQHGANYYHFINEENLAKYDEMKEVVDLFRKIGMVNIFNAINNACLSEKSGLIPGEYKSFYTEIICCRYLHLILRVPLDAIRIRLDNGFPWKELI